MKSTNWFYKTEAWKQCRDAYWKHAGGLCERCYAKGFIKAGEIVHHKQYLTPETAHDPSIALNWDNLELLCRECHGVEHAKFKKRYKVDLLGRVKIVDSLP